MRDEDILRQNVIEICSVQVGSGPRCDPDGQIIELVPYLHTARLVMLVVGAVLCLAPRFNINFTRIILLYWLVHKMFDIEMTL